MDSYAIDSDLKEMLLKLPELNGGKDTIDKARAVFLKANDDVKNALADLKQLRKNWQRVSRRCLSVSI